MFIFNNQALAVQPANFVNGKADFFRFNSVTIQFYLSVFS